jgi:hypothetical protein
MRRLFSALVFCLGVIVGRSQFTYIGGHTGYNATVFALGHYKTMAQHQFVIGFDVLARPLRNLGLGFSVDGGIVQKSTHRFDDGCNTCNWDSPNNSDTRARYVPSTFEYEMIRRTAITARARYFYGQLMKAYVGFDLSFFTFTETFRFTRDDKPAVWWSSGDIQYGEVSTLNLASSTDHSIVAPGFSIGAMPHLGKSTYMDINYTLQILKFSGPSFSYRIANDWDSLSETEEESTVESPMKGIKSAHCFHLGFGYYF